MCLKKILKKIIPQFLVNQYHHLLAWLGAVWYGWPSNKLIVIGVTGTSGKSTTVLLIAKILEEAGFKVGYTSTIGFKIDQEEWLNEHKVTMLGWFFNQRLLSRMVKAGCQYAIIESASQGVVQYRHVGINYDVMVFTNLHEEHIEAHGSFENYKKAKAKLFEHLMKYKHKELRIKNQELRIKKQIVVNLDDDEAEYFVGFSADEKWGYGLNDKVRTINDKLNSKFKISNDNMLVVRDVELNSNGSKFNIQYSIFNIFLFGEYNVYNSLAAISVAHALGIDFETCARGLGKVRAIPGHMEEIENDKGFRIFVDYAFEPKALEKSYAVVHDLIKPERRIIHVLGSCGGGRDKTRRPVLGKMSAENADVVIVTNEDPYDEDPEEIMDQVAAGAEDTRYKIQDTKNIQYPIFKILNRREAIRKALELADDGDLVFITGKGCEQFICMAGGKKISWDDRMVVRDELGKLS